jgi:hypothetical protein
MVLLANLSHKPLIVKVALVGAFFTALTLLKSYPLIHHFATQLPGGLGDPLLVTWILAWNVHALTTNPLNLFHANIFYPAENVLALSEHMIAVAPIFAPAYLLTSNPILAYNIVFVLAFIFSGMTMFLLVQHWTANFWASLLSGCLFAFAPIRFAELSHLQLANFYWAPLALLFLDKFVWSKRWADLAWFATFYWLQMLASVYLGWLMTIAMVVYLLYHVIRIDRGLLTRSMMPRYAAFIVGSLLVLLPFHLPYYMVQRQWGFSTSVQECMYWAADVLLNYLSPPYLFNAAYLSLVQSYFPRVHNPPNQQMLFPGIVLSSLAVVGSLSVMKSPSVDRPLQLQRLYRIVLIVAVVLSLGPFLVILGRTTSLPLPYLLLYYLVPGFHAMRVPGRFALLVALAASVLAALGFLRACAALQSRWGLTQRGINSLQGGLALCWIGLFMLELGFMPMPLASIATGEDVPKVYRWLATKPLNGPIVELPLGQSFWQALKYMYFSTYHWLPLVNGTSRYSPPTYEQLSSEIAALPSRESAELLSAIGVKGLVLHTDQLEPSEVALWQQAKLSEIGLEEIARFGSDVVYRLAPVEGMSPLYLGLAVPEQLPSGEIPQLPSGAMIKLGLRAANMNHRRWVHPSLMGQTPVQIRWEEIQTGKGQIQLEKIALPLTLRAEEIWATGLPIRTPPASGRYRLSLDMPALGLKAAPKLVQVSSNADHTSTNAHQSLAAAYILVEPSSQTLTTRIIDLTLQATNTGQSIWLADAKNDKGKVRLGWRWYKGNDGMPFREGRGDLPYDIFPGQAHTFRTTIKAPLEPGAYTLELGLVCELLTWFSDRGVPPVKFMVHVDSPAGLPPPGSLGAASH